MAKSEAFLVYQYLHETLGIQYIPKSLPTVETPASSIIWQHPHFKPNYIFLNLDPSTDISDSKVFDLFGKIVQAMDMTADQVWYADSQGRSFMDFLNWLKNQNLVAPLVVMKQDPDIQNFIQNAGAFDWVECFSLQTMLEKANLKKPTWEVLKLLMEKK